MPGNIPSDKCFCGARWCIGWRACVGVCGVPAALRFCGGGNDRAVQRQQRRAEEARGKKFLKDKLQGVFFHLSARSAGGRRAGHMPLAILMMSPIMPMMMMIRMMSRQILSPARTFSIVSLS